MESERVPCPYRDKLKCNASFASKDTAKVHARKFHEEKTVPCPHAEDLGCPEKFGTTQDAKRHSIKVHGDGRYFCPKAEGGCKRTFTSEEDALKHAEAKHTGNDKRYPCPYQKECGCNDTFTTKEGAAGHARAKHEKPAVPCPHAVEFECKELFHTKDKAQRHAKHAHGKAIFPCPYVEDGCESTFVTEGEARRYAKVDHEGHTYDCTHPGCPKKFKCESSVREHFERVHIRREGEFLFAWPRLLPGVFVKDSNGNGVPSWEKLPQAIEVGERYGCPDDACEKTYSRKTQVRHHYLREHMDTVWPCPCLERFHCLEKFSSREEAANHAWYEHSEYSQYRYICQFETCWSHIREVKFVSFYEHEARHIDKGHHLKGEYPPLKMSDHSKSKSALSNDRYRSPLHLLVIVSKERTNC
jgi:hypothetical protein